LGEGCVTKLDSSGALATSYGNGGTYCAASDDLTWGVAIEVLPDGSSIIGGTADMTGDADMAVLKLLPDGKPATSFGVGGRVRWARPGPQQVTSLHVDGKDRIVVAGTCGDVDAACAIRLSPDGHADPWFGEGSLAMLGAFSDVGATTDFAFAPDGTMFFVGGEGTGKGSLVALEPERGTLVPAFGVAGVASFPQATSFFGVSWDDGFLHVVGTAGTDATARSLSMRVSPQGLVDAGYGEQGTFVHPGGFGSGLAIALAPGRATILTADNGNFRLMRVWR
jgi:hypothetical protein